MFVEKFPVSLVLWSPRFGSYQEVSFFSYCNIKMIWRKDRLIGHQCWPIWDRTWIMQHTFFNCYVALVKRVLAASWKKVRHLLTRKMRITRFPFITESHHQFGATSAKFVFPPVLLPPSYNDNTVCSQHLSLGNGLKVLSFSPEYVEILILWCAASSPNSIPARRADCHWIPRCFNLHADRVAVFLILFLIRWTVPLPESACGESNCD